MLVISVNAPVLEDAINTYSLKMGYVRMTGE